MGGLFLDLYRLQNSRFFLKISKEIGKVWRKSLTRAKRASLSLSLSLIPDLLFDCSQKYGLFCSLRPIWLNMESRL